MRNEYPPDLSLFLDILQTLEAIGAPYMVIGAFAGAVYGVTRTTSFPRKSITFTAMR